jgi:hypothetical protein
MFFSNGEWHMKWLRRIFNWLKRIFGMSEFDGLLPKLNDLLLAAQCDLLQDAEKNILRNLFCLGMTEYDLFSDLLNLRFDYFINKVCRLYSNQSKEEIFNVVRVMYFRKMKPAEVVVELLSNQKKKKDIENIQSIRGKFLNTGATTPKPGDS